MSSMQIDRLSVKEFKQLKWIDLNPLQKRIATGAEKST